MRKRKFLNSWNSRNLDQFLQSFYGLYSSILNYFWIQVSVTYKFLFEFGSEQARRVNKWLFQYLAIFNSVFLLFIRILIWCTRRFHYLGYLVVYLQENGHTCNIVNHLIVSSPFLCSSSHDGITCLFGTVSKVEWPHNLANFLIRQELKNTVTSNNDEFVFRFELESHYFWVGRDACGMSYVVSNRSAHGKTWKVLVLEPHSLRA